MSEIKKILKALNEDLSDMRSMPKRAWYLALHEEKMSNHCLLRGIMHLLGDAALDMGVDVDFEELTREIYGVE